MTTARKSHEESPHELRSGEEGTDVRELYQELILDHSRNPRNFRKIDGAGHHAEGYNPLCGDRFTVYLDVQNGVVKNIGFEGSGCAISKASASVMTQSVKGKTPAEVTALIDRFRNLVTGEDAGAAGSMESLGKLAAFSGVKEFPVRVKCATLAWHTVKAALEGKPSAISTED
ncbi:MAG: SUF system NifU family Fe-S cluster assembly protein [Nitrospirae bacterium]|nr:SUF system NifU family Fe-S cluster assembly protein [Nitrospirota bacterium]